MCVCVCVCVCVCCKDIVFFLALTQPPTLYTYVHSFLTFQSLSITDVLHFSLSLAVATPDAMAALKQIVGTGLDQEVAVLAAASIFVLS